MNPRDEAFARLGGHYEVRVLEPSRPAVQDPTWLADDPAVPGDMPPGREVVVPTERPDAISWNSLTAADRDLAKWCAERWLGAWRRLRDLPPSFVETRIALHSLAEHVLAPARHAANGKIGLRFTRRGFGTPFFVRDDAEMQVRVEGAELYLVRDEAERARDITTLAAAAAFVGVPGGAPVDVYHPTTKFDTDARLRVDIESSCALGDWYGFVTSVLEQMRAEARVDEDVSRVQIWPEHFDPAVEIGRAAEHRRAGFGGSPGDETHPEPYLYVGPWEKDDHPFWGDASFGGASMPYATLCRAPDQRGAALAFFREALEVLRAR